MQLKKSEEDCEKMSVNAFKTICAQLYFFYVL